MDKKIIYYISIAIIILYFFIKRNKISNSRTINRITKEKNIVEENFNSKSLKELKPIVFEPKSEFKSNLYVFIDIFCGNSKRFHNNIDACLNNGIKVHYFASPMSNYTKKYLNYIWSLPDKQKKEVLSDAFNNTYSQKKNDNNKYVNNHIALAKELQINRIPFIIIDNDYTIPGNIPSETLLKIINLK